MPDLLSGRFPPRRLKSFVHWERTGPGEPPPPGTATWLRTGLWFGLATGWLELGLALGLRLWNHRVTVATIRTNRQWIWMVPVSDVLIFTAAGLLLGLLARSRPWLVARVAPWLLAALGFFALLLRVEGLHLLACITLACGLARLVASSIRRWGPGFDRLVRASTPFLAVAVVLLVGIVGGRARLAERRALASLPPPRPGAPNVVLIVLDNVRADALSLYGYQRDTTPNLARLARRGIRFEQARSAAPWTLPSHASMFTGRWPHELSARSDRPLDASVPTLAEFLAAHGYATAGFVGNTYYCNAWYGLDRGFSRYEDFYANQAVSPLEIFQSSTLGRRITNLAGIPTETPGEKRSRKTAAMINRDALAWLDRRGRAERDRPFFLFLNYYDAHGPYQPPDDFKTRYGMAALPLAVRESILLDFARLSYRKDRKGDVNEIIEKASRLLRDAYDSCIAYSDDQLGRLFEELEARGLRDNTLVIVTSDHGEQFGERQLFGHGNSLYRPLVHVPLVIFPPAGTTPSPAARGARNVREPVTLRDLAATTVDVLGLRDGAPFPGRSLARYWTSTAPGAGAEPAEALDDPLLSEVEHQRIYRPNPIVPASLGPVHSLVAHSRVYIRNSDGREELYDLDHDPSESHNLAGAEDAAALLDRFRRELAQFFDGGRIRY